MLNIFLAPQRDSTQTEAPRVVHTYTLGTSAALGMNCAVIPSFIIYTNVPRQSATAGLRLHGLLDSDQNNCQIVCEHCCSPSLTGNTTDTQRIQLSCHARPLLWCACARKQTFSGSDTLGLDLRFSQTRAKAWDIERTTRNYFCLLKLLQTLSCMTLSHLIENIMNNNIL